MRSRYLVKMAVSPGSAALLSSTIGIGLGALINRHKRKKGEEVEHPWLAPTIGGILTATPAIFYGIARHSLDKGPDGRHSIPLIKRWFMNDDKFFSESAYAAYNRAKKNQDYLYRNSYEVKDKMYPMINGKPQDKNVKKSSFDNALCNIDVNSFNQEIWADASRGRTPTEAAGLVSDTLAQTSNRFGSRYVSPGQIIDTMVNAGIGYGTAWLAGKTLGAMAGLSESAQDKLKEIGTWGGIMNGIGNSISN